MEEAAVAARRREHRRRPLVSAAMDDTERRAIEQDCARLVALYANRNDAVDWEGVAALYAPDGRMA
ncbi:MAG: nuclear transport factor 2 family protein, partial [Sphingomonadales bacterium]